MVSREGGRKSEGGEPGKEEERKREKEREGGRIQRNKEGNGIGDLYLINEYIGLPCWVSGKEPTCQCRRCQRRGFDPWVGKMPWRREWQPTPVFLPRESMDRGAWWTTQSVGSQAKDTA